MASAVASVVRQSIRYLRYTRPRRPQTMAMTDPAGPGGIYGTRRKSMVVPSAVTDAKAAADLALSKIDGYALAPDPETGVGGW